MITLNYSDKGPRDQNQDFVAFEKFEDTTVIVVADGVGGNRGGSTASRLACESFVQLIKSGASPAEAISATHSIIRESAATDPGLTGMATTLTGALFNGRRMYGVHVGDSRIYQLRKNGIKQITEDHSEVSRLLKQGKITKEFAETYPRKNILYSAIGVSSEFIYHDFDIELQSKDRIMIITDGIYSVLNKKQIRDISLKNSDISDFFKEIIEATVISKPKDNFTISATEIE